jgi:hypothetical protein
MFTTANPSIGGFDVRGLKLARYPLSLGATHRAFTFYLGNPLPRLMFDVKTSKRKPGGRRSREDVIPPVVPHPRDYGVASVEAAVWLLTRALPIARPFPKGTMQSIQRRPRTSYSSYFLAVA